MRRSATTDQETVARAAVCLQWCSLQLNGRARPLTALTLYNIIHNNNSNNNITVSSYTLHTAQHSAAQATNA